MLKKFISDSTGFQNYLKCDKVGIFDFQVSHFCFSHRYQFLEFYRVQMSYTKYNCYKQIPYSRLFNPRVKFIFETLNAGQIQGRVNFKGGLNFFVKNQVYNCFNCRIEKEVSNDKVRRCPYHRIHNTVVVCGDGGYDKLIHRSHSEFYTERTRVKLKGAG